MLLTTETAIHIPSQDVITMDNAQAAADAIAFYQPTDAATKPEGARQASIREAEGRREAAFRDVEARKRPAEAEARDGTVLKVETP